MSMENTINFSDKIVTIERYVLEQQQNFPEATGVLTNLLYDLALAGKFIASHTNRAGLAEILGLEGRTNIQGEDVTKLDVLADRTIYRMTDHTGRLAVMASEEHEDILAIPEKYPTGKYVLLFDPLDGSSNVDYNVAVGTIFSIYRRITPDGPGTLQDCLQKGRNLVAAGYIIYGPSTMLVLTTGNGVQGFTLDPRVGEFLLSHPDMKLPTRPKYYSVNHGYYPYWGAGMKKFIEFLQDKNQVGDSLSLRYIGSLVADFHRNLLSGGIYCYPSDRKSPLGKLRILYEAAPLAFIAEQAGGYASNGQRNIMEIEPTSLHQRTPLFIGNKVLVEKAEEFLAFEVNNKEI